MNKKIVLFSIIFLISISSVYALIGNEDDPGLSCIHIKNNRVAAPSGIYWIDPDGSGGVDKFPVYCDMYTDGGGWMLVMSYHHAANDNSLVINSITDPSYGIFPLNPNPDPYIQDENSHVDNLQAWGFGLGDVIEVMLYCDSSVSGKVIHYKTTNNNVIRSIFDDSVNAICDDLKSDITTFGDHTGNLPLSCGFFKTQDSNHIFGYEFPMREKKDFALYNWALAAFEGYSSNIWACDDAFSVGSSAETHHRVYVRGVSVAPSYECVLGPKGDDAPAGYETFRRTYLFYNGLDNYNGHLSLGDLVGDQEFFCPIATNERVTIVDTPPNIPLIYLSCKGGSTDFNNCQPSEYDGNGNNPDYDAVLYFNQISSIGPTCYIPENPGVDCDEGDLCILKMSSKMNAHVASCHPDQDPGPSYPYKLCCDYTGGSFCGDGIITPLYEECDCGDPDDPNFWGCSGPGANLGGETCESLGFPPHDPPVLSCYQTGEDKCHFNTDDCGTWLNESSYYLVNECYCPSASNDNCANGIGEQIKTVYVWDYDTNSYIAQVPPEIVSCFLEVEEPIPFIDGWFAVIALVIIISYYLFRKKIKRKA